MTNGKKNQKVLKLCVLKLKFEFYQNSGRFWPANIWIYDQISSAANLQKVVTQKLLKISN